ncbi:MAG: hypothetical protein IJH95_04160 [Mogibacterium sp.]|nr:hypothetical protein [Mogibacterium sp.]
MKITTFNPQIITKDAKALAELFKEIGFEIRHNPSGIGDLKVEGIRMKDANGFCLDISQPDIELEHDLTAIRMNGDDFDEAYGMLTDKGFRNYYGDRIVETASSRSAIMISPSGFAFNLIQHVKKQ